MCNACVIESVKQTMMSRRSLFMGVAAHVFGRLDTPLTRRGRRQAEALSVRLAEAEIDDVVASPTARARETAAICAAPHGLAVRLDLELVEFDWGVWTGLPLDDEMERSVA